MPTLSCHRLFALCATVAVSACSGSGGTIGGPTPVTTAEGIAPRPAAGGATQARFIITVPNASSLPTSERRPAYISSATQSVVITLAAVDGAAYTGAPSSIATDLTTSDPSCSGSPPTCTVSAPAVAGSDTFTVVTYDQARSSSTPATPSGNVLSRASSP